MITAYTNICSKNVPGNRNMFLTEIQNIASVSIVGGEVSALTMGVGKVFSQIRARTDTIRRIETAERSIAKAYEHSLTFTLDMMGQDTNDFTLQMKNASQCGMTSVVLDMNGKAWLVGWNYNEAYKRALYIKGYNYTSNSSVWEGASLNFDLYSRNECRDIPFNDTLTAYIIAMRAGDTLPFDEETYGAWLLENGDYFITEDGQTIILE